MPSSWSSQNSDILIENWKFIILIDEPGIIGATNIFALDQLSVHDLLWLGGWRCISVWIINFFWVITSESFSATNICILYNSSSWFIIWNSYFIKCGRSYLRKFIQFYMSELWYIVIKLLCFQNIDHGCNLNLWSYSISICNLSVAVYLVDQIILVW